MGRTNKLVDGCYSYWQGALFPLLQSLQQPQRQLDTAAAAAASPAAAAASRQQQGPSTAQQDAPDPAKSPQSSAQHVDAGRSITVPPLPPLSQKGLLACAAGTAEALQALESEQHGLPQPAEAVHLAEVIVMSVKSSAVAAYALSRHATPCHSGCRACQTLSFLGVQASTRAEGFAAAAQNCATVLAMRWGADTDASKAAAARPGDAQPAAAAGCGTAGSEAEAAGVAAAAEEGGISCCPVFTVNPSPLYDVEALQLWLLQCCQVVSAQCGPTTPHAGESATESTTTLHRYVPSVVST